MRKRVSVLVASVVAGLFALLFLVYILFSNVNGQISQTSLNIMEGLGLVVIIAGIGILANLRQPDSTFGDAHFASMQEIRQAGFTAKEPGSLILGETKHQAIAIPPARQYEHILLVATTGAGKSTGIIIPGLLTEPGTRGIFVNDMKGELYQRSAGALSRYMVTRMLAPARTHESISYNPLAHIEQQEDAEDLAACWVDNTGISREPYYNDVARLLITAVVLHIIDTEPNAPFSQVADLLSSTSFDQIRTIFNKSKSARAKSVGSAFLNSVGSDPKLAGAIMSGMATRFLVMKNETLRRLTSTHTDPHQNLDFKQLTTEPEALFLSVPASDTRRLKPITSLLVLQMMNHLARQASRKPFILYMDELANIGNIPHYAEYISLIRDQDVALVQAIQNFSQLESVYGKEDAQTIIANSTTKVFYPGMGKPECEFASQLLGTKTVALKSKTTSSTTTASLSESVTHRLLMNPEEIRQLTKGCIIVVSGSYPPMLMQNTPYYQQPALIERASLPVKKPAQKLPTPTKTTTFLLIDDPNDTRPTPDDWPTL